jgi:hypothetical protein
VHDRHPSCCHLDVGTGVEGRHDAERARAERG